VDLSSLRHFAATGHFIYEYILGDMYRKGSRKTTKGHLVTRMYKIHRSPRFDRRNRNCKAVLTPTIVQYPVIDPWQEKSPAMHP